MMSCFTKALLLDMNMARPFTGGLDLEGRKVRKPHTSL
jgi:hypothetical protein